jgi:hypothetical protein
MKSVIQLKILKSWSNESLAKLKIVKQVQLKRVEKYVNHLLYKNKLHDLLL